MKRSELLINNLFQNKEIKKYAQNAWGGLNLRTVNGIYHDETPQHKSYLQKGIRLEVIKDEFLYFIKTNEEKILQMMDEGERPSIDRIDNSKHYSLDNMQIITLHDNIMKRNTKPNKHKAKLSKLRTALKNRKKYIESKLNESNGQIELSEFDKFLINNFPSTVEQLINAGLVGYELPNSIKSNIEIPLENN